MSNYQTAFKLAEERTAKYGLTPPTVEYKNHVYLTDENTLKMHKAITGGFENLTVDQLAGQCIGMHYSLLPKIQEVLGIPVYYTVGYVNNLGEDYFKFDEGYIEEVMNQPHDKTSFDIHTWLTLPSMEIIDLSFATTLAKAWDMKELAGRVFAQHADTFDRMTYHPMLVGDDFLFKSGAMKVTRTWN